jgi:hypothetical protein
LLLSCLLLVLLVPVPTVRAVEYLPTSVEVTIACGDGIAEGAEVCDPGRIPDIPPETGTTTCSDFNDIFGDPFETGTLSCLVDCSDYDPGPCNTCGNGAKESVEQCDGADFGGQSCIGFGFTGGALLCTAGCNISTANCEAPDEEGGISGEGPRGGGSSSGFSPGAQTQVKSRVIMRGKSYPNADVHILIDGVVVGIVQADAKADFYFESNEVTPGVASFGFWSEDVLGLKSTLLTLTFRVISGAVTTISGVYIAPTIEVDKKSVIQGETVTIYGQTVPETEVHVHVNSETEYIEQISSSPAGAWSLPFDTSPLEEDFHTAKALFQIEADGSVVKSGFSKSVSFAVGRIGGEPACAEADLNKDGRVNLTDFSILLFYWGTDNPCADQNQNGIVDLIDFSIMMYYWTG